MTEKPILTVKIDVGNDATLHPSDQADLLRSVAEKIESGDSEGSIIDYNGNKVGHFDITITPDVKFEGLEKTLSRDAITDLFQDKWEPDQEHIFDLIDLVKESFKAQPVDVLGYEGRSFNVPVEYIEQYKAKGEGYLNDYFLTVIEDVEYWNFITEVTTLVAEEVVDHLGLNWDQLHVEAQGQVSDTIMDLIDGWIKPYLIDELISQADV